MVVTAECWCHLSQCALCHFSIDFVEFHLSGHRYSTRDTYSYKLHATLHFLHLFIGECALFRTILGQCHTHTHSTTRSRTREPESNEKQWFLASTSSTVITIPHNHPFVEIDWPRIIFLCVSEEFCCCWIMIILPLTGWVCVCVCCRRVLKNVSTFNPHTRKIPRTIWCKVKHNKSFKLHLTWHPQANQWVVSYVLYEYICRRRVLCMNLITYYSFINRGDFRDERHKGFLFCCFIVEENFNSTVSSHLVYLSLSVSRPPTTVNTLIAWNAKNSAHKPYDIRRTSMKTNCKLNVSGPNVRMVRLCESVYVVRSEKSTVDRSVGQITRVVFTSECVRSRFNHFGRLCVSAWCIPIINR